MNLWEFQFNGRGVSQTSDLSDFLGIRYVTNFIKLFGSLALPAKLLKVDDLSFLVWLAS